MISEATVHWLATVVYLGTLSVFLVRLGRVPDRFERLYRLVAVVLGLGVVTSALLALGVGTIPRAGTDLDLPSVVNDAVAYPLLWYVTARLGGASRRMLAVVTVLPFAQVLAFQFGASAGGLLGLASSLLVIGGHVVLVYLFMGPIWRSTRSLPDGRRILHWKGRNLLLFLIGMLITFAFLSLASAFTTWATLIINQYVGLLIRVGFAGFLLVNVGALVARSSGDGPTDDATADEAVAADAPGSPASPDPAD